MAFNPQDYRARLTISSGDWDLELAVRGWTGGWPSDRAHLLRPDLVRLVADAFLDAGAEILLTNTAHANPLALAGSSEPGAGSLDELAAINRQAAAICRAAVAEFPAKGRVVFGALGPSERLLMLGEIEEGELFEAYRTQAQALALGGVDAILCNSFTELAALCVALRAARTVGLPLAASLTFDSGATGMETALGCTADQACTALADAGADIVGCDGGENPDAMPAVVGCLKKGSGRPVWAQCPAGIPQVVEGKTVYVEKPTEFAARLKPLIAAGASIVGGARGASTRHIAALAKAWSISRGKKVGRASPGC